MLEVQVHVHIRQSQSHELLYTAPLAGNWGQFRVDSMQHDDHSLHQQVVAPCVLEHFIQGDPCMVWVYGAADTGKSQVLEGTKSSPSLPAKGGIIPNATALIFAKLERVPKHRYRLLVTACGLSAGADAFMLDLLSSGLPCACLKDAAPGAAWGKLAKHQLTCPEDIHKVLKLARQAREQAVRPLHTCITIQLIGQAADGEQLQTSLSFVELVASDARDPLGRPIITDTSLSRSISLAYSSLSSVVSALKQQPAGAVPTVGGVLERGRAVPHVPWRNSPLTRWLQHQLAQSRQLVLVATVSPAPQAAPDTLATLSWVCKLRSANCNEGVMVTASWEASPGATRVRASRAQQANLTQAATPNSANISQRTDSCMSDNRETGTAFAFVSTPNTARSKAKDAWDSYSPSVPQPDANKEGNSQPASDQYTSRSPSHVTHVTSVSPSVAGFKPGSGKGARSPLASQQQRLASPGRGKGVPEQAANKSNVPHTAVVGQHEHARRTSTPERRLLQERASAVPWNSSKNTTIPNRTCTTSPGRHAGLDPTSPQAACMMPLEHADDQHATYSTHTTPGAMQRSHSAMSTRGAAMQVSQKQGPGALSVPPARSPSKSAQQDHLSAYLEVLRALKLAAPPNLLQAEAHLEYLYAAVCAKEAQVHAWGPGAARPPNNAAMEQLVLELQQQLDESNKQLQEYETQHVLQQLDEVAMKEQAWSTRESALQRQMISLQQQLDSRQAALEASVLQVSQAQQETTEVRAARAQLEQQLQGTTQKLQAQVLSLTEDISRLKQRAVEAAAHSQQQAASKRGLEAELAQLHAQLEVQASAVAASQQRLANVQQQLEDTQALLEAGRAERACIQDAKWQVEEQLQLLQAQADQAMTAQRQAEMETRAVMDKAQAEAQSAASTVSRLQTQLSTADAAARTVKAQFAQLQAAFEEQKRLESRSARDMKDVEGMLREFERDVEVHTPSLWKEIRAERADVLLLAPDRAMLTTAARWKPVLRSLLSSLRKEMDNAARQGELLQHAQQQLDVAQAKASQVDELSAGLSAQQAAQVHTLSELSACKAELQATLEDLQQLQNANTLNDAARQQLQLQYEQLAEVAAEVEGLRKQAQVRDHLFGMVWSELLNMRSALAATQHAIGTATINAAATTPVGAGDTFSSTPGSSGKQRFGGRSLLGLLQEPMRGSPAGVLSAHDSMDWADPACQQQIITIVSSTRVQVSAMMAELLQCQHELEGYSKLQAEHSQLQNQMEETEGNLADVTARLAALQASYAALDGTLRDREQEHVQALRNKDDELSIVMQQVSNLRKDLEAAQLSQHACESRLADVQAVAQASAQQFERRLCELHGERKLAVEQAEARSRDTQVEMRALQQLLDSDKAQLQASEAEVVELRAALKAASCCSAADSAARQQAETEAASVTANAKQLQAQLKEASQQAAATAARLQATERALMDSNARVSDLSSKLALAETDARLKVQELASRVAASEDKEQLGAAQHLEVQQQLLQQLETAQQEVQQLRAELSAAHVQRRQALDEAAAAEQQATECKVQVQDASFIHTQLHAVMADRDNLQSTVQQLRSAQLSAAQEGMTLRQELEAVRGELVRTANERMHLAAQLEAARLESVVNSTLARTKGMKTAAGSMSASHTQENLIAAVHAATPLTTTGTKLMAELATPSSTPSRAHNSLTSTLPGLLAKCGLASPMASPLATPSFTTPVATLLSKTVPRFMPVPQKSALAVPPLTGVSGSAGRVQRSTPGTPAT